MSIDFLHNRVIRGDISEPILKWVVWLKTPFGYVETMDELLEICAEAQLDPNMTTIPIPVAITATTHEVYER
jgi:hypothetical protein